MDNRLLGGHVVKQHDLIAYRSHVARQNQDHQDAAEKLLQAGTDQARIGQQRQARASLESAWHYSRSDAALNEDARVQLSQLIRQQALIGLLGSRQRLRSQMGRSDAVRAPQVNEQIRQDDTERLDSTLSKQDSENLERITHRMVQMQMASSQRPPQLLVNLPQRGRLIAFDRPIQVNAGAPMWIDLSARPKMTDQVRQNVLALSGVFVVLLVLGAAGGQLVRMQGRSEPDDNAAQDD